jgi:hypothetical protein
MYTATAYLLYILISVIITVFVSRTLSKNGEIYLIDGFNGNEALAKSVNHLLVVGFYLLNLGFVLLRMQTTMPIELVDELLIYLRTNIGTVMFILGVLHFFIMFVFHRFRAIQIKKNREDAEFDLAKNIECA